MGRGVRGALALAAVETGALVGAGFASGREVFEFFAVHGAGGRAGVVLFAVLLAVLGGLMLDGARRAGSRSYIAFARATAGPRVAQITDPLVAFGLFVGLAVTLAGAGALLDQLGWGHAAIGVLACGAVTAAIAWRGERGVVAANAVVVPVLIGLVLLVAGAPQLADLVSWHAGVGALVGASGGSAAQYFLYNGLLAVVLFGSLGGRATSPRAAWLAAGLAALALGVLALSILDALQAHPGVAARALPMMALAARRGHTVYALYALALALALFTTAVGNAYGLAARLGAMERGRAPLAVVPVAAAVPLALVGFVPLVRYGYRLVAVAGLVYLCTLAAGSLLGGGRGRTPRW